jgi:hypothetical protein
VHDESQWRRAVPTLSRSSLMGIRGKSETTVVARGRVLSGQYR